jgi:hypothetical protein
MAKGYVYKCVSVPRLIRTGSVGKDDPGTAIVAYEKIINTAAEGGWELLQADSISSAQQPGCLAGLSGSKVERS